MARTQKINYGNGVTLPTTLDALVPDRPYNRIGLAVKNRGSNVMNVTLPSGFIYKLDPGATLNAFNGFLLEDGPYTITGTAAEVFDFWEAY